MPPENEIAARDKIIILHARKAMFGFAWGLCVAFACLENESYFHVIRMINFVYIFVTFGIAFLNVLSAGELDLLEWTVLAALYVGRNVIALTHVAKNATVETCRAPRTAVTTWWSDLWKTRYFTYTTGDAKECRGLLKAKTLTWNGRTLTNKLSQHASRSEMNVRLVQAFDIHNCFVTDDRHICENFQTVAKRYVTRSDEEWRDSSDELQLDVANQFPGSGEMEFKLAPKVQLIALKAIIFVFREWGFHGEWRDDEQYGELARAINEQWMRSKSSTEEAMAQRGKLLRMAAKVSTYERTGNNPFNMLLPGFETLWRVVFRCLLEVGFRSYNGRDKWQATLQNFAKDPSVKNLYAIGDEQDDVSAAYIAKEALRLYPPTRRIYRRFEDESHRIVVDAAADVEASHRDTAIWGVNADKFAPARWFKVSEVEESSNFFAFGAAPFQCLAKRVDAEVKQTHMPFGIAMVALVTGKLLEFVNKDDYDLKMSTEEQEDFRAGKPLKTEREDYMDLTICAKRPDV